MRYLIILLFISLVSCSKNIKNDSKNDSILKETLTGDENNFSLSPNESKEIVLNNLSIIVSFEDLIEDSRCAPDVECVSAGSGTIKLKVGNSPELLDVVNNRYASSLIYANANGDRYKIEFRQLDPLAPSSERPVAKSKYKAYFTIKKI